MATRSILGLVFSPSWLRVAHAEMSSSRHYSVRLFGVPLPVGCINESSGAIEDSATLRDVLHTLPQRPLNQVREGGVFLVIPQLLCYRTSFVVPAELAKAPVAEIIKSYPIDLPGDRTSLIFDGYAHGVNLDGPRSVMVIAARRSSLQSYCRLFEDLQWCLGGITTGEIARYNRWRLQCPKLDSQVALVCSADIDSRELSLWDRGVLVASDTRHWYQRAQNRLTRSLGAKKAIDTRNCIDVPTDQLAREVAEMIKRAVTLTRPIERILCCGILSNHPQFQEVVQGLTDIRCETSQGVNRYMTVSADTGEGSGFRVQDSQGLGIFDDVLGAIAHRVGSQHV
jgi:hypothetical protein